MLQRVWLALVELWGFASSVKGLVTSVSGVAFRDRIVKVLRTAATYGFAIGALLACSPQGPKPEARVSVPDVVSMWLGQAYFALQHAGLTAVDDDAGAASPSDRPASTLPFALCVLTQTPPAGAIVAKGSVVHLRAGFDSRCGARASPSV